MVEANARGLGEFGKILPVLDRRVEAGASVSDGALFAALLLPTVLLRRFDLESKRARALARAELAAMVNGVIEPFCRRFALSKERVRLTTESLIGFLRLCEAPKSGAVRLAVAARAFFPDALFLFELLAEATGEGFEELAQWQAAARRRPVLAARAEPTGAGAGEGTALPERRRRRRRRR